MLPTINGGKPMEILLVEDCTDEAELTMLDFFVASHDSQDLVVIESWDHDGLAQRGKQFVLPMSELGIDATQSLGQA